MCSEEINIGWSNKCESIRGIAFKPSQAGVIIIALSTLSLISFLTHLSIRLIGGKMYELSDQEKEKAFIREAKGSYFHDTYFSNLADKRVAKRSMVGLKESKDTREEKEDL